YLSLMRGELQHLSRLIDDLFELSQIDSGTVTLHRAPLHLPDLITETLAAYQARARDAGITLESQVPPALPEVQGDAVRLQRVLRNLLDNAVEHTPPGRTVHV